VRLKNGRQFLREWLLEQLPQFAKQLQATDDVAVEATHRGSTMPGPRRIIHLTLKDNWVFEDFPNFVLREASARKGLPKQRSRQTS
jgi:hypothetical protein